MEDLMIQAAQVIRRYHRQAKSKPTREAFRVAILKQNRLTDVRVFGVRIPRSAVKKILAVRAVEDELLRKHRRLVGCVIKRMKSQLTYSYLDESDLESEGQIALLNCFYGYSNPNIQFSTYAYQAIRNRFIKVLIASRNDRLRQPHGLAHLVSKMKKLATRYPDASFDELADYLELSQDQRKTLQEVESGPVREYPNEYNIPHKTAQESRDEILEQIFNLSLTDLERAVVEACIQGSHGWQSDVARQFINPNTGKPYSRVMPKVVLERLRKRLEAA